MPLAHGDVVVWGGPARLRYHGIMPRKEGHHPLMGGHRIKLITRQGQLPIYAEADFCISGVVEPELRLPEGPFGF